MLSPAPSPPSPPFPYTTLFRSYVLAPDGKAALPTTDLELWKIRSPLTGKFADPKYDWYTNYGDVACTNSNDQGLTLPLRLRWTRRDRKSTRLNSSHVEISYAVSRALPAISPLSLHDALPILRAGPGRQGRAADDRPRALEDPEPADREVCGPEVRLVHELRRRCVHELERPGPHAPAPAALDPARSEEHTSELQSRRDLVCCLPRPPRHLPPFPTRRSSDLTCWPRTARPRCRRQTSSSGRSGAR